jgi:hypothetical protein
MLGPSGRDPVHQTTDQVLDLPRPNFGGRVIPKGRATECRLRLGQPPARRFNFAVEQVYCQREDAGGPDQAIRFIRTKSALASAPSQRPGR